MTQIAHIARRFHSTLKRNSRPRNANRAQPAAIHTMSEDVTPPPTPSSPESNAENKSPKLRKNSPWFNLIVCSPELSDGAKSLYQLLLFLWGEFIDSRGRAHERLNPGYRYIAQVLGCRQESIRGWLDQLVQFEWLQVATTKPRENILKRYTLLDGFGKPLTTDIKKKYVAFQFATKNRSRAATEKRSSKKRYGKAEQTCYGKPKPMSSLRRREKNSSRDGASLAPDSATQSGSSAVGELDRYIESGGRI